MLPLDLCCIMCHGVCGLCTDSNCLDRLCALKSLQFLNFVFAQKSGSEYFVVDLLAECCIVNTIVNCGLLLGYCFLFVRCGICKALASTQYSLSRCLALALRRPLYCLVLRLFSNYCFFANFKLLLFVFVLTWGFSPQPHSGAGP
jgi:hypothetical protein